MIEASGYPMTDHIQWPCGTRKGYMDAYEGDGLVMERLHMARGTVQPQTSPTLTCGRGGGCGTVLRNEGDSMDSPKFCIRYLTEKECLRLMGQSEEAIDKIMATGTSKTKLYSMAGNSIVVDVLADIFKGIYIDKTFGKKEKRPKLEDFL